MTQDQKPSFNLIDEDWIPVVLANNKLREVSLRHLFANAATIRDLHDDSPLVVVSILRLLLAIVMAAEPWRSADEAEREDLWREWWSSQILPLKEINHYLDKWHRRFDLFDDELPFMQTGRLEMDKRDAPVRLAFEEQLGQSFAYPENTTWTRVVPSRGASLVLSTQNFSLGFGQSSDATIDGTKVIVPDSGDGPLLRGITVWHSGADLRETILLNMFPSEQSRSDCPSWELPKPHELRDRALAETTGLKSDERKRKPVVEPRGYMDLYTWHSRLLRTIPSPDDPTALQAVFFTQGRSLEKPKDRPPYFDPMKLYRPNENSYETMSLDRHKAAWRDAAALFAAAGKRQAGEQGLLASRWLAQAVADDLVARDRLHRINIVGLAKGDQAGKFVLWRHDRIRVPLAILEDENCIEQVDIALREAESIAWVLLRRFSLVCHCFINPTWEEGTPEETRALANNLAKWNSFSDRSIPVEHRKTVHMARCYDPQRDYWPTLESRFEKLLLDLATAEDITVPTGHWLDDIQQEARACFRESREQLGDQFRSYRSASISDYFKAPSRYRQSGNTTQPDAEEIEEEVI